MKYSLQTSTPGKTLIYAAGSKINFCQLEERVTWFEGVQNGESFCRWARINQEKNPREARRQDKGRGAYSEALSVGTRIQVRKLIIHIANLQAETFFTSSNTNQNSIEIIRRGKKNWWGACWDRLYSVWYCKDKLMLAWLLPKHRQSDSLQRGLKVHTRWLCLWCPWIYTFHMLHWLHFSSTLFFAWHFNLVSYDFVYNCWLVLKHCPTWHYDHSTHSFLESNIRSTEVQTMHKAATATPFKRSHARGVKIATKSTTKETESLPFKWSDQGTRNACRTWLLLAAVAQWHEAAGGGASGQATQAVAWSPDVPWHRHRMQQLYFAYNLEVKVAWRHRTLPDTVRVVPGESYGEVPSLSCCCEDFWGAWLFASTLYSIAGCVGRCWHRVMLTFPQNLPQDYVD